MANFMVVLNAPKFLLFDFLADPRNRLAWQSSLINLHMQSDGEPRVGMKWREHARGFGHFQMEITECVRGESWAERGTSSRGSIELRLEFKELLANSLTPPEPSRTQINLSLQMKLHGFFSLANPVAPTLIGPLLKADLRRAARLVQERR